MSENAPPAAEPPPYLPPLKKNFQAASSNKQSSLFELKLWWMLQINLWISFGIESGNFEEFITPFSTPPPPSHLPHALSFGGNSENGRWVGNVSSPMRYGKDIMGHWKTLFASKKQRKQRGLKVGEEDAQKDVKKRETKREGKRSYKDLCLPSEIVYQIWTTACDGITKWFWLNS